MQDKQQITVAIFDMDGVLVDSEYDFLQRIEMILRSWGYEPQPETISSLVGQMNIC